MTIADTRLERAHDVPGFECTCEKLGLAPNHHTMYELSGEGDTRTIWNPENPDEVAAAKDTWQRLVKDKKYLAYRVDAEGGKGEQIREFDPSVGRMILAPQLVGG